MVLASSFRFAVEKTFSKFVDSADELLEFPTTLNKDQRHFISEFAYTKYSLKSKEVGKGDALHIVISKSSENLHPMTVSTLDLRVSSKKCIIKMLDLVGNDPKAAAEDVMVQEKQHLSLDLVSIGGMSRPNNSVITVPPVSSNPKCIRNRQALPIYKYRRDILDTIRSHQVVIIESSTGSGKSTQIPQYLLEESIENNQPCRIIVAEPRRICATSLAERVSYERGEEIGGTVGFQIRLESKVSPASNLIFVTNGVILRMLMSGKPEEFFNGITALVIDEVHERDKFSDFLLLCVREYLKLNKNLRVIIMSATIESDLFADYFDQCPVYSIVGRAYDVKEEFLEDIIKKLNFKNERVTDLYKKLQEDPEFLNRPTADCLDEQQNLDDDTKDQVNAYLEKISSSADCENDISLFSYMVQAENVPVDYRHVKTGKTALMFAVEYGFKEVVVKLLNMKANPLLTAMINGAETNAIDIAIAQKNQLFANILTNHMELRNGPNPAANGGAVIESSPLDRMILDIYYDTLILPGINRGAFLDDVVDLQLIVRLVCRLYFNTDADNAILIFLPGHDEIIQLANMLCNALDTNYNIFILHSQMMTGDQSRVFQEMPFGVRKIILATNIAESSITVNDVVYVIDSGKEKRRDFNAVNHVSSLKSHWISKASAKQRMGRTGRCGKGVVFRLYSRDRYSFLVENPKPEFLRDDMTDICLQAKMISKSGEKIEEFLNRAITPPTPLTIEHSIKTLQNIGALRRDQSLTKLGLYLADIPLSAKYGKMLIYGIIFKCIDPVLTLVSILSISDPFTLPFRQEMREKCHNIKLKLEDQSFSDHFVLLRIFQKWNEYKSSKEFDAGFCEDNFLNAGAMERIASTRSKIVGYLRSVRLIQSVGNIAPLNEYSNDWSIVKACLTAGSYPEIARIVPNSKDFRTSVDPKVTINPGSVLRPKYGLEISKEEISHFPADWMIFEEKNLAGKYGMAKTCTLVSGIVIAMTVGDGITIRRQIWANEGEKEVEDGDEEVEIAIDEFVKFKTTMVVAKALKRMRDLLNQLIDNFLECVEKFRFKENDEILIHGLCKILNLEDEKAGFKVKYEGIGARPRIITRDYNTVRERRPMTVALDKTKISNTEVVQPMQLKPQQLLNAFSSMHIDAKKEGASIELPDTQNKAIGEWKIETEDLKENFGMNEMVDRKVIPQNVDLKFPATTAENDQRNPFQNHQDNNLTFKAQDVPLEAPKEEKICLEFKEQEINNVEVQIPQKKLESCPSRSMKYFMMELKSEEFVEALKAKTFVYMDSDVESLQEAEGPKKTMVFCFNKKVVGVGLVLDPKNDHTKREEMKMFFMREQQVDFSKLQIELQIIEEMNKKSLVEIPQEVGKRVVQMCTKKAEA